MVVVVDRQWSAKRTRSMLGVGFEKKEWVPVPLGDTT